MSELNFANTKAQLAEIEPKLSTITHLFQPSQVFYRIIVDQEIR